MNSNRKKKLFRWMKIVVLLYALIGIILYYVQDYILFHPVAIERNVPYKFDVPFEETDLAINETDTVNLVKFFPKDSVRKGVVLYFHGNKGNINRYAKFAANFTSHGYEVWMEDYPGFGKSVGERNEKILYREAEQVYKLANSKYGKDSIVVYGKSFGTGIAAYVAAVQGCRQLILETPYYSMHSLVSHYFPVFAVSRLIHYRLPTFEYLPKVAAPVTIFHGTSDWVIPYSNATDLHEVLKPGDEFITIEGGSHNDLNEFPLMRQKLDSLLSEP